MKKILFLFFFLFCGYFEANGQINYGTTGLMNMPTADMQRDKTFMAGANWLSHHATVPRWWYDTFNYSINITIFPWLEVGYLCTGHKAVPVDYEGRRGYWVPATYGKFVNQDRSFHFRLRAWKEGWWKSWTPQIVVGANDAIGDSWNGGSLSTNSKKDTGNGFWNRYYIAVTKHFDFANIGRLGGHIAFIYSARNDNHLKHPAIGTNFKFDLPRTKFLNKAISGVNLMAELVPGYTDIGENFRFDPNQSKYNFNVGIEYSFWKDYINAIVEWNKLKSISAGVTFKVHLR